MASPRFPPSGRSRRRRHALVALFVALSLALAGCSVLGGSNGLPDGETAADRFTSLDGYSGTLEMNYRGGEGENRTVALKLRPKTGESRVEVLEPAHRKGNVVVYNGTRIIQYNATRNEVRRISVSGVDRTARRGEHVRLIVERARSESESASGRVGVSPLPVVPGLDRTASPGGADGAVQYEYEYLGTEEVLGRTAYVVRMTAVNGTGAPSVRNQTLWLDSEWFVTLKGHAVVRFDDERISYRMRFREITFEPGLSNATFRFERPPDATVNESRSLESSVYDSRAALADAAGTSVPDPVVPDGFELETARVVAGEDVEQVLLNYEDDTSRLFVTKANSTDADSQSAGEVVDVGTREGRYAEYGRSARVTWTCDGNRYSVGGEVSKETLLAVAESTVCD